MSFLIKLKTWAVRAAFLLAGILGGVLGTALWGRFCGNEKDNEEQEEEKSADEYGKEQFNFEKIEEIRQEKREEILSLPNDDFDQHFPSVPRDARKGGDRFVDRCRTYLQSRRGRSDRGSPDDHSPGGD